MLCTNVPLTTIGRFSLDPRNAFCCRGVIEFNAHIAPSRTVGGSGAVLPASVEKPRHKFAAKMRRLIAAHGVDYTIIASTRTLGGGDFGRFFFVHHEFHKCRFLCRRRQRPFHDGLAHKSIASMQYYIFIIFHNHSRGATHSAKCKSKIMRADGV